MQLNVPKEKVVSRTSAAYEKLQEKYINSDLIGKHKIKKPIDLLNDFDSEIMELRSKIDPSAKSYRYDSVRLDILCLQRDITESQEVMHILESELVETKQKLKILELKIGLLEMVVTQLCKPESRDFLTVNIAQEVCERWKSMHGGSNGIC